MKFQSFYPTIFICVYITLAPTIAAYTTYTYLDMYASTCKIWAEDSNGNLIAGDEDGYDCDHIIHPDKTFNVPNQTYWVHAKVAASFRKPKVRGPYNENTCFHIYGTVTDWAFDQTSCS
ncbi:hypothetical protein C2G38_2028372 [Gigaspora rosea]|uniref:Uncharacterized protein n=1 Tax=Gigaspora rosea TaxID=44941 RepID=A0A397W367_9GLOM|nr:hypothetical protein C2G38_2028372 [Gigaspora rosea]